MLDETSVVTIVQALCMLLLIDASFLLYLGANSDQMHLEKVLTGSMKWTNELWSLFAFNNHP